MIDQNDDEVAAAPMHCGTATMRWSRTAAYWPHNERAITASYDCTVRVWSTVSGECRQVLKGHADPVMCMAIHGDRYVCCTSFPHLLALYSLVTGSRDRTSQLGVSSRRKYASRIRLWNRRAEDGNWQYDGDMAATTLKIECILVCRIHPHLIVAAGSDMHIRVWHMYQRTCLISIRERKGVADDTKSHHMHDTRACHRRPTHATHRPSGRHGHIVAHQSRWDGVSVCAPAPLCAGKCVHMHLNSPVTHVAATDTRFVCVYGYEKKMIIVRVEDILKFV
ncbi:unnamed protein product [Sphagnum balticum]